VKYQVARRRIDSPNESEIIDPGDYDTLEAVYIAVDSFTYTYEKSSQRGKWKFFPIRKTITIELLESKS